MDDSREVIQLINRLQNYFRSTGVQAQINLPQIVVVGAQSSGKSSVLDGLVGFSILPRGSGTVTKCPIIVQLITIEEGSAEKGVEFVDDKEDLGRINDHDIVRQRISDLMDKNNGAITEDPIIVRVYSPDVVTLTVVDLPGIKRISSSGEPSDLEDLIFGLSRKYINEDNAIILAVSPANYDICNSDGILLAREADPDGNRTIGVLTKLDLMDEGTNARDLLTGTSKDVNLKLGMIGLVNRSQKDIDNHVSVEQQLKKERNFLSDNYTDLAHINGVPYLRQRLHALLVQHIRKCLPDILTKFEKLLDDTERQLEGIPDVSSAKNKYAFVNRAVTQFERGMLTEIEGSSRSPEYSYLYGGIRIKDVFEKHFAEEMEKVGRKSDAEITDKMIQTAFRNSGSYDSMFVYPEAVFRKLAQNQVKHIEVPALNCAKKVYDLIQSVATRNLNDKIQSFTHFPELKNTMKKVVNSMLNNHLEELRTQIKDYIRVQSSIVFSLDASFLKKIADLRRKLEKNLHFDEDEESTAEEIEVLGANSATPISRNGFNPNYVDPHNPINGLPTVPQSSLKFPDARTVSKRLKITGNADRWLENFKRPEITKLIKQMVQQYFNLIKSHTQDYVPKLVADRLITQFSSDGGLADELRLHILEDCDRLATLPDNINDCRRANVNLRDRLIHAIAEVRDILNVHGNMENEDGDELAYMYED